MKLITVVQEFVRIWENRAQTNNDALGLGVEFKNSDFYEIMAKVLNTEEMQLANLSDISEMMHEKFIEEGIIDKAGFPEISIAATYQLMDRAHFDRDIFISMNLPETVRTAGVSNPIVIIEPVDEGHYAYAAKVNGEVKKKMVEILAQEVYPENRKKKPIVNYSIMVEGKEITIKPFDVSDISVVTGYRYETLTKLFDSPPTTKALWREIRAFFKNYLDIEDFYYDIITLYIFQTYLAPAMQSVFYVQIKAPFGGGKTTLGTAMASLSRHGYTVANASPASVARGIEARQATVFFDEIDQGQKYDEESSLWNVLRIGQKRGSDIYERVNAMGEVQRFKVFGPKIFAVHSQIEEALSQRSVPIVLYPTTKGDLVIKNLFRESESMALKTKMLSWYLHYGLPALRKLYDARTTDIGGTHYFSNETSRDAFNKVVNTYKKMGLTPRNVELFMVMSLLAEALDIDIYSSIDEVLKVKLQEDEEFRDLGTIDIVRETIIDWYNKISDNSSWGFSTSEGYIVVPYDMVFQFVSQKLKKLGIPSISARKLRGILRELSIDKPEIFKKLSLPQVKWSRDDGDYKPTVKRTSRRAFVFNEDLCRILGVEKKKGDTGIYEFEEKSNTEKLESA